MLSIKAISDEIHPFELGFIQFSDQEKMSEIVTNRQMYMMYIGAIGCFECILRAIQYKRPSFYIFEGGSQFRCAFSKNGIFIEYMGFSGTYDRAEVFNACKSFLAESFQVLSSAGYGEHAVAEDLLQTAKSFQS